MADTHSAGTKSELMKEADNLGMFTNSAESFILFYYLKTGFQLTKIL